MNLLILTLLFTTHAWAGRAWICAPQDSSLNDPKLLIAEGTAPQEGLLVLETDLIREEGKLPRGEYQGKLTASPSGKGKLFKLSTGDFFPNLDHPQLGTEFTLPLSLNNSQFVAEAYVMWPCESGACAFGLFLNEYGCRLRN